MPTEQDINDAWLATATAVFFVKAAVFAVLAWLVARESRRIASEPTELGGALLRLFASTAVISMVLSGLFGIAMAAAYWGFTAEFWFRMTVRGVVILAAGAVVVHGVLVVRAVLSEARQPTVAQRVETGRAEGHARG